MRTRKEIPQTQSTHRGALGWLFVGISVGLAICRNFSNALSKAFAATAPGLAPRPVAVATKPVRSEDRDIEPVRGPKAERREHVGLIAVVSLFSVAIAAGIGFLFVYWSGGSNRLLGITLAIALGAFGSGLVLAAHALMRQREAVEPREPVASTTEEEESASREFYAGERQIHRRKLLVGMVTAVAAVFAAAIVSLFRSFAADPGPALFPVVWKRGQRLMTGKSEPITLNSLEVGAMVTVFPEDSIGSVNAQTVLVRVPERFLQLPKARANWAPLGYVAYSRVCTHAGCPVGEYEEQTNLLLCPCHQSTFAVLQAAQPTAGPAARPLPQLPLYIDSDGTLRAAGDFSSPPGPGFWSMPPS